MASSGRESSIYTPHTGGVAKAKSFYQAYELAWHSILTQPPAMRPLADTAEHAAVNEERTDLMGMRRHQLYQALQDGQRIRLATRGCCFAFHLAWHTCYIGIHVHYVHLV